MKLSYNGIYIVSMDEQSLERLDKADQSRTGDTIPTEEIIRFNTAWTPSHEIFTAYHYSTLFKEVSDGIYKAWDYIN